MAVTKANIQSVLSPDRVVGLASRAHVRPVGGCPLDPLHHPDLDRGVVQVVHGDGGQGLGLSEAANIAQWWTHAAGCTGWEN